MKMGHSPIVINENINKTVPYWITILEFKVILSLKFNLYGINTAIRLKNSETEL